MTSLTPLFIALANAFDGPETIESHAATALRSTAADAQYDGDATPLPPAILDVLAAPDAHPICALIAKLPLAWAPPQTSDDPDYIAHSLRKVHVELLGPDGLVHSDKVRLGLYGMLPDAEYGIRTHPAEEVFVMLAGEAYWKRGTGDYASHGPGERSYHPSMTPHANKTEAKAFMSAYVWHGDVSTERYVYAGISQGRA